MSKVARFTLFLAVPLVLAACGGTGTTSGHVDVRSGSSYNAPRAGQIKPTKVIWLQGRTAGACDGCAGADAWDNGSADEYLLQLKTDALAADCVVFYYGAQCAFVPVAKLPLGAKPSSPYDGKFPPAKSGQQAPVATFWLQTRYRADDGTQTYDGGEVNEYLLNLRSGYKADCVDFSQVGDNGQQFCAFLTPDDQLVSTSSTAASFSTGS
jgi:hypothetical protein